MLIISSIWFTFDLSISSVLRPCLYMLGSSSLTQVFCMCKTVLHSLYVNVESITPDHHMVSRHDELSQRCIFRENTYTLKFSERSSYNATDVLSKIRCIKDKHHMQSKYVTWYGHHHLVPLISISKHRHDLHRHRLDTLISIVASWSSCQLLLLQLLLPHSDKVKQLHGDCISYNKATTIWLLPVVDNFVTKHDHLIQQFISHHVLTISHHNMPCKNKLDVLYFVVANFTWLLRA